MWRFKCLMRTNSIITNQKNMFGCDKLKWICVNNLNRLHYSRSPQYKNIVLVLGFPGFTVLPHTGILNGGRILIFYEIQYFYYI